MILAPNILISRPKIDALSLRNMLPTSRVTPHCIIAPVIEIQNLPVQTTDRDIDTIIITSRHAVSVAARLYPHIPAVCVGDATARHAQKVGLTAISAGGTSEDIIKVLVRRKAGKCLHLHGEHTRGDITRKLNAAQIQTKSLVVYAQKEIAFSDAILTQVHAASSLIIPLYSPRSAALVSKNIGQYQGHTTLIPISNDTRDAWSGPKVNEIMIANHPNAASMLAAITYQMHRTT